MRPRSDFPAAVRRKHIWTRQAGVAIALVLGVASGARVDGQAVQDRATAAAAPRNQCPGEVVSTSLIRCWAARVNGIL